MATQIKSEHPPATNEESDPESDNQEDEPDDDQPADNVARILKQLQSTGALIKKPKQEYRCVTCDEDFSAWGPLESHLLQHVTLPTVLLEKIPSDDEVESEDEWSDEEGPPAAGAPQKIDVSQLLKNPALQIKNPALQIKTPTKTDSASALNKLSGLGFTIKKNNTPIKEEKADKPNDLMQKLGQLGGLKLKLKSEGTNSNSFKVINGLKDFQTSDNEDSDGGNSDGEQQGDGQTSRKNSESDDSSDNIPIAAAKKASHENNQVPLPKVVPKQEPVKSTPAEPPPPLARRPAVKQTPKRGANLPIGLKVRDMQSEPQSQLSPGSSTRSSIDSNNSGLENVTVKKEVDAEPHPAVPLFSGQVKTERSSPPIEEISTPVISNVKTEIDPTPVQTNNTPLFSQNSIANTQSQNTPLLPVAKTESSVTVIEINGDSNDEDDDDCCVVSATPAPDVKPVIPKTEPLAPPAYTMPPAYPTSSTSYTTPTSEPPRLHPMTEKQHSFNWNAPDSKPPIDMLEKSADDIFESLLSSGTKKENMTIGESEYISLDRLGSQYSCDVCNTRFTNSALFDDHIRQTGHSKSIITPTSSLMPYQPSNSMMAGQNPNSILASLLPVKHLAEQVGKIGTIGTLGSSSSGAFTHQQNVMINIQAYPGTGGMMPPPQPQYNAYGAQNMPGNMHTQYAQQQPNMNSMYGAPGSGPGQYPGSYVGQQSYGQQYNQMPQNPYNQMPQAPTSQYSSPLQGMQQSVYQQSPGMPSQAPGSMGPPMYVPSSSPGQMKPPMAPPSTSGIKIQNVQTFPPPGGVGPQGPTPGQPVRLAAPLRPRMPVTVRGARPSIRPGVQVRGGKAGGPRMPMKRPGVGPGPPQKRRPDMLLPGRHDNEDCTVMAMQKQREGMPMIHSVKGAQDKLGSQISITKKAPVNREANAMANVLASRGISIKQKQKSRSPSPERPLPHIPNLPAGMSIKATSKSSNFSIPEAKVGGGGHACRVCRKMFMSQNSLAVHMSTAHPNSKIPVFTCDECPASYPKSLQLQHHKRVFHNVTGPNRELGLPVVDLSQEENLKKLSNLGIYSFIPLANREQASGCFGIPIISVHNMQNGITNNLQALGADGLLSLGPLKPLPNT